MCAAIRDLAPLRLLSGIRGQGGALWLMVPRVDYQGAIYAMFQMIRQNGSD